MEFTIANETLKRVSFWDFKGYAEFIDDWLLMSSPIPILLIICAYLLVVLKLGPDYMKKRPPFDLTNLLLWYNVVQVIVSAVLFTYGTIILWPQGLVHRRCIIEEGSTRMIALGIYWYMWAKISELLDTAFFILRKKQNQVTFLHVYHHSIMLIGTWGTVKYEPTYAAVFMGTLNSFVHIIMYSYYGLSALPNMAKYLWWKKYITSMQLLQFVAVMLQSLANFVYSACPPTYGLLYFILFNGVVFLYLFGDFYVKSYDNKKKPRKENGVASLEKNNGISYGTINADSNGLKKRTISCRG